MMATMKRLEEFNEMYSVTSPRTEKKYNVVIGPTGPTCNCEGYVKSKKVCWHILRVYLDRAKSQIDYLSAREPSPPHQLFKTFEQAQDHLTWGKNSQTNYISNLILTLLYTERSITSDDVYILLNGSFTGEQGYKKLGLIFGSLRRRGLIWREKDRVYSRRRENHGREQSVWHLTEFGQDLMGHVISTGGCE